MVYLRNATWRGTMSLKDTGEAALTRSFVWQLSLGNERK